MKRWAAVVVLLLVAMSLGRLVNDHLDGEDMVSAPFVRAGELGKPVHLEYADLTATGVRSGRYIDGVSTVVAAGVWLIVDSRHVATKERVFIADVAFVDAKGRRFPAEDRGSACSRGFGLPTGAVRHVMSCFDVPTDPELLAGGKLQVSRGQADGGDTRRDEVAEIDLGIDLAEAKRLVASTLAYDGHQAGFNEIPTDPIPVPGIPS